MKLKHQLPLQRLIAKIDNDFNISESDWIPRVAAWTIDALSQINQYCKDVKPYVQISCISENPDTIANFIEQKTKWSNSFKKIIIL